MADTPSGETGAKVDSNSPANKPAVTQVSPVSNKTEAGSKSGSRKNP